MQKSIKKTNKVTKSNDLIRSAHKLTLYENRIISTLISMIEPSDENFQVYKFSVKEFQEMLGVKGHLHTYIKRIVTGLQEKVVEIPTPNSTLVVNWLASAEYFDNEGYIELEISNKLKPYLLGLKERFTSYHLQYILRLNSFHSQRLYELLKQYQFLKYNNKPTELETLRKWLGFIEDDKQKYTQYGHFNAKVLKVAEKEINEKTDISFSYKEIKQGRKVVAIEFSIQNKGTVLVGGPAAGIKDGENGQQEFDLPEEVDYGKLLLTYGVTKTRISTILNEIPMEQIQRNLTYVEEQKAQGKVEKLGGFTYNAIVNDYAANSIPVKQLTPKKPIRTEPEVGWLEEVKQERERIRLEEQMTMEEKRSRYWEEFVSQEKFESYVLKLWNLNKRLQSYNDKSQSPENDAFIRTCETFITHNKKREDLDIDLLKPEDFIDLEVRKLYEKYQARELEPVNI